MSLFYHVLSRSGSISWQENRSKMRKIYTKCQYFRQLFAPRGGEARTNPLIIQTLKGNWGERASNLHNGDRLPVLGQRLLPS
jgi:hypothetical protein